MAGHGNGDQFRPLLDDYLNAAHRDEAALVSWARKVTSPCDNDDPEESLWQLWRASLDCARAQSDCNGQPRRERIASLIQLTAAIKAIHPPPLNSKGEISECWAGKLFVDMPILGATMREALDGEHGLLGEIPSSLADQQAVIFRTVQIISARMAQSDYLFGYTYARKGC